MLPPAVYALAKSLLVSGSTRKLEKHTRNPLDDYLDEPWSLFRQAIAESRTFLEFGAGHSTEFAALNSSCVIRSVETDQEFANAVGKRLGSRAELILVDLGPVGRWGYPKTYDHRDRFSQYLEVGFSGGFSPDLVLIDGRFRVACFLTTLLLSQPGTKIVFDDYAISANYQVVTNVLSPVAVSSRQALFVRPDQVDRDRIEKFRDQFRYVMD